MKLNYLFFFVLLIPINVIIISRLNLAIQNQALAMHGFLLVLTYYTQRAQVKRFKKPITKPFDTLKLNIIRMLLCGVFLAIVLVYNEEEVRRFLVYNFFILYFIYLLSEIIFFKKFSDE
ncbi:MAG: hypothetical protein CMP51_02430 [Flavobacteriales bacterium]|nr:hypothetical protein [Flavobacteriales bacterium]|tara:strand:+ start:1110 stop:1466 length:357 start_codon:yes stop_codon:yes gene_type:complete